MEKGKKLIMRRLSRGKNDTRKPFIDNNNRQAACDQETSMQDDCVEQNTSNNQQEDGLQPEEDLQPEEEMTHKEVAELLQVQLDDTSIASEDEVCCSVRPGQEQLDPGIISLIHRSVSQHFPKPPADLDQNLQQHLMNVQNAVLTELKRLGPALKPMWLMGCLIDCYHRQTCDHLHSLLQDTSSCKNLFVLINWGLKTYLSKELLGDPELIRMDPIKEVDLLLFMEWGVKAKDKLLENVQKEISGFLEKILLHDQEQKHCKSDEASVGLYVDTTSCINAMSTAAQDISSELSCRVQEICFQELQTFVERYKAEQTEFLNKEANAKEPEMIHFFRTLKTCHELKTYIQTKAKSCADTVEMLKNLEAVTLNHLKDVVTGIAKSHLENYFKADKKQFSSLIDALKRDFKKQEIFQDVQQKAMNMAYNIIVHTYSEHLMQIKLKKLKRCWNPKVGKKVTEDAELLHNTISDLAPGVEQWNLVLLKITEVLDCEGNDALKMVVAGMQNESVTKREDLHKLLQWKGLSKQEVKEVLDALPEEYRPSPRSRSPSLYSCFRLANADGF